MPNDLWGTAIPETNVQIEGNYLLENTANRIVALTKQFPNLLAGNTMQEIDRKLLLAIWHESGLKDYLGSWDSFSEWVKSDKFVDQDTVTRARRFLLQHDKIRVSAMAVRDAEQKRQRTERSLRQ